MTDAAKSSQALRRRQMQNSSERSFTVTPKLQQQSQPPTLNASARMVRKKVSSHFPELVNKRLKMYYENSPRKEELKPTRPSCQTKRKNFI